MHRKSSQKSALLLWTFWVLILDLCLDILQFLHAKDVKKFGCVHSTVQKIVQQFLCLQSKCMLCEVRMLIDISDILGNITNNWSWYIMRILSQLFGLQLWCHIVSFSPSTTKSWVRRKASQQWVIFRMRTVAIWNSTSCLNH